MTTDTTPEAVERLADSYVLPGMPKDCRPVVTAATLRAIAAERDALRAEALDWRGQVGELSDLVKALRADNDRLRGELATIKGACDSTKGEHVIMKDGKYKFCIHCGETMTASKIKAAEDYVHARAALDAKP
jgi:hypothetical protein